MEVLNVCQKITISDVISEIGQKIDGKTEIEEKSNGNSEMLTPLRPPRGKKETSGIDPVNFPSWYN